MPINIPLQGLKKVEINIPLFGLQTTIQPQELNLGLPPIGGMKTTTKPVALPGKIFKPGEVLKGEAIPGALEKITAEPPKLPIPFGEKVEKVGLGVESIMQSINRNIASAGLTFAKGEELRVEDFPESLQHIARGLFGEEEIIKPIEQRVAETELTLKKWGEETAKTTVDEGIKKWANFIGKHPEIFAFAGVIGSVGLDLTPFGGLEKGAYRAMIKAKTIGEATSVLSKMGVADDLVRQFAPDVVKVIDEKTAKALFTHIAEVQKTTKVVPKIAPIAQKAIPEAIPAEKGIIPQVWEKGIERPFTFDPNSTINEGRFRLLSPEQIEKGTYFRRKSSTSGVSYVMGKNMETGKSEIQAIRFDKSIIPERKAKIWWEANKNRFNFAQAVKGVKEVKPVISAIPQELQPLAQEARKVKIGEKTIDDLITIDGKKFFGNKIIDEKSGKNVGGVFYRVLPTDNIDLARIEIKPEFRNKGFTKSTVDRIFKDNPLTKEISVDATESSKGVWEKIGFKLDSYKAEKGLTRYSISKNDFYAQAVKGVKEITKPAVNIERLNIPQEAKQRIIKASEEIKPQLEAVKGKVLSNDEVIEAAQSSEILRRTTNREATLKSEAALLKTREHLAALAKQEKITPEFIDTLKIVSEEATKRGRELQALGIEADPALGTIKTKLVKQLIDMGIETDRIVEASKGIDFNNAQQVAQFYRKFIKPTLPEIIDEYRYINMLSSPKTQIVNTFSNLLQAIALRPITRLASGIVDSFAHILTGKEQEFYIKQVPTYFKGAFNSFGDALSEAMKVMRGEQQIYRPDVRNIPTRLKILKPFQVVPRLMEASDVFFRKIITGGEIEALMSKGVSEAEAVSKAAKTAEELVFRKALDPLNKTGQGVLLSKIDALTTAIYKLRAVPGVKWFIPFVQTPMNILKQGIEYSPLGISTLAKNTNKIEQFGKTLVGTTVFAGAGWLALKDRTTWAVPTNQKEKDAFYAAGMQPYSVKIGDNWVSYSRLGVLAYPMAMAAAIKFYTKDNPKAVGDTEFQKITKILSGIAQFFSDQSYVQGIGDFINLAQGDITALTRAASQIPSQLIPLSSLQRWIANMIDPIYRKTEKKLSLEGIIENLKSGIPFLTKGLPPYITPTGEPSKRPFPFINPISPVSISEESFEWRDYFNTLLQVSRERTLEKKSKEELKKSAQDLYDKMKVLPQEDAERQFDDLIKSNPDLAEEISNLVKKNELDYKEAFFKSLGVENGQRAKYIVQELNKLSEEEKYDYYQNLIDKKVITEKVNKQILEFLNLNLKQPEENANYFIQNFEARKEEITDIKNWNRYFEFLKSRQGETRLEKQPGFLKRTAQKIVLEIRTILGKTPFIEKMVKTPAEQAQINDAFRQYPFTDTFKNLVKQFDYDEEYPEIEPVLGLVKGKKPYAGATEYINFGFERIVRRIALADSGSNVAAHEMLHGWLETVGLPKPWKEFDKEWERNKPKYRSLQNIDGLLNNSPLYKNMSRIGITHERFAYLGERAGGLKEIPLELQIYYEKVFSR